MDKTATILFLACYFLLLVSPIIIAYWRRHPRRHYITIITLVSALVCIGPLPCLIWACWTIQFKIQLGEYEYPIKKPDDIMALINDPTNDYEMVRVLVSPYLGRNDASLWPQMRYYIQQSPAAWAKRIFHALKNETARLKRRTLSEEDVHRVLENEGKKDAERVVNGKAPKYVALRGAFPMFLKLVLIPGTIFTLLIGFIGFWGSLNPTWENVHPLLLLAVLGLSGALGFGTLIGLVIWLKLYGNKEDY